MSNIELFKQNVPSGLRAEDAKAANDELVGGIHGGFAVVSIRGKVWRIKHQGAEKVLMRDDGDGPRSSFDAVIVKAASHPSKIFYEHGYEEGSSAPPDCFSADGQKPDPSAQKPQSSTCAACPHNVFGSGPQGRGKRCQDSKRLAIVPLYDLANSLFDGPMLLRIPPASLTELRKLANELKPYNHTYYSVAVRLSFDVETEYPRVKIDALRPLTDDEFTQIQEWRSDALVGRILDEATEMAAPPPAPTKSPFLEASEPPKQQAKPKAPPMEPVHDPETGEISDAEYTEVEEEKPKQQAKPKAETSKAAPKQQQKQPEPKENTQGGAADEFDDMLEGLIG